MSRRNRIGVGLGCALLAATAAVPVYAADDAAQPAPAPKKLIQKTTQSKPVSFSPVVITFDRDADKKAAAKERPRIVKNK